MRAGLTRCAALLFAAGAMWSQVWAQSPDVQLAPSPPVACMTPIASERGVPEYPFAPWKRGEGGRVLVEAVFTGPALEPEIKIIESQGDASLVKAVKAHVAAFRVPCLRDDQVPLRLRQQYVFLIDEQKVEWTTPVDVADAARRRQLQCMAAQDGSKSPDYPRWAQQAQAEGNLLAQLRFTSPDKPPEAKVHAASRGMKGFIENVERWTAKLRMPCLEGGPLEAAVSFSFRMEGNPPFGFRNIDFMHFLGMVKDIDKQTVSFDTTTMACPFDMKVQYLQPYMPNSVAEGGPPVAARRPLLEWVSKLVLDLAPRQLDSVLGDTAAFSVPCLKIDLKPKEKTS